MRGACNLTKSYGYGHDWGEKLAYTLFGWKQRAVSGPRRKAISMPVPDTYVAYSRFGLGARPGDLDRLTDGRSALIAEIETPGALEIRLEDLPDTAEAYALIRADQRARQMAGAVVAPQANTALNTPGNGRGVGVPVGLMRDELSVRLRRIGRAEIGFGERLVAFWTNHFAVEASSNQVVRGLAGAFEREAIRPHVLGRFHDLLLGATRHPAMLTYLNNAISVGPGSVQGQRRSRGLNENHARELMELHTLGVDGGYTQADVTSLAKVLTGWTFGRNQRPPENFGRFYFARQTHEPGQQTVLGAVYDQEGIGQGEAVLADLARSPATARHIATKLARHFVADQPPQALVERLAGVFTDSDGDLHSVSRALIEAPEAWAMPAVKLRSPQEFLWSSLRALDIDPSPQEMIRIFADLGQPLWDPPSPQGFDDDTASLLAPNAMTKRLDVAALLATRAKGADDPRDIARDVLGAALSQATATAIERAESRVQALTLMLMSPEFQRR